MNPQDAEQLNVVVRDTLSPYLCGDYQLTPAGQEKVIGANADLGEEYAMAQNLPVADWCYREIMRKLMVLPPKEYGTLLDVCAGTGYVSLNLMRKRQFKKCVALDINPKALEILKARSLAMDIEGIECQVGNIYQTSFPSDSFDCIMGNSFLHHLPDTHSFLKEMHRILKPGGVFCLTREPSVSTVWWENWIPMTIKRILGREHWPKENIPLTDIWQFKKSSLIDVFQRAGFAHVEVVGFGRMSSSISTLVNRIFVRFSGAPRPAWVGYITDLLRVIDFGPNPRLKADQWAALSISSRKIS